MQVPVRCQQQWNYVPLSVAIGQLRQRSATHYVEGAKHYTSTRDRIQLAMASSELWPLAPFRQTPPPPTTPYRDSGPPQNTPFSGVYREAGAGSCERALSTISGIVVCSYSMSTFWFYYDYCHTMQEYYFFVNGNEKFNVSIGLHNEKCNYSHNFSSL